MKLQDLRDNYKSKTAEERYEYYRTLPLDEKDLSTYFYNYSNIFYNR